MTACRFLVDTNVCYCSYDIVGRFNGGANAGHTVVVGEHKFAFHLLPCGLIYPHTQNLLGNGTVIHLPSLYNELAPLDAAGISWAGRLKLSDRATLLFDFHKTVDGLLEEMRKGAGEFCWRFASSCEVPRASSSCWSCVLS